MLWCKWRPIAYKLLKVFGVIHAGFQSVEEIWATFPVVGNGVRSGREAVFKDAPDGAEPVFPRDLFALGVTAAVI